MFAGRQRELCAIGEAFLAGVSLVTITGPGGIGKSRLARELMKTSHAARFVDLSAASTLGALSDRIAVALDLPPGADLSAALAEQSSLLIVLDDFDALVPHGVEPFARFVERAPEIAWLVTSRVRLGLPEEKLIELGGLTLPDRDPERSEALALFSHRAELAGVSLSAADRAFAAELVAELGGCPLAIELAASRLSVLNVRALLHRVRSDPGALARSGGPERHRSMEAVFESSWASLGEIERRALACSSVFRGGFTFEAAEAVLGELFPGADVLGVVQRLRDRSLLSSDAASRLDLPPALRELARRKLADAHVAEAAHARFYLDWAEQHRDAAPAESQNLLRIVERVVNAGERVDRRAAEDALRALWLLSPGDRARLSLAECVEAVRPVVEKSEGSGARPELFARGLLLRGEATLRRGDGDRALADFARAEAMARALGDAELSLAALLAIASVAVRRERFDEARELLERAGAGTFEVDALSAIVAARTGDPRALALLERAAVRAAALGRDESAAELRLEIAEHELDLARLDEAAERVRSLSIPSRAVSARALALSGRIAADRGDLAEASEQLERALSELRALGATEDIARVALHAAAVARLSGNAALAHVLISDALPQLDGAPPSERALAHHLLALLERAAGDTERAEAELAAAHAAGALRDGAARRLLERAAPGAPPALPNDVLLVARDGAWFRPPHAERVSLERRRPLARLLAALCAAQARGEPELARDALVEAGWPGERILPTAAAHRVRVAVSTLRKLGLGDALLTTEHGYAMRRDVPFLSVD